MANRVRVKLKVNIGGGSSLVLSAGTVVEVSQRRADELVADGSAEILKVKRVRPEAAAVEPDEAAMKPQAKLRKKFG